MKNSRIFMSLALEMHITNRATGFFIRDLLDNDETVLGT
jgi:hypothetical protein